MNVCIDINAICMSMSHSGTTRNGNIKKEEILTQDEVLEDQTEEVCQSL